MVKRNWLVLITHKINQYCFGGVCKQCVCVGVWTQDGCDLICRCGSKPYDSAMNYHGIGDHQIECPPENDELDERLLPMWLDAGDWQAAVVDDRCWCYWFFHFSCPYVYCNLPCSCSWHVNVASQRAELSVNDVVSYDWLRTNVMMYVCSCWNWLLLDVAFLAWVSVPLLVWQLKVRASFCKYVNYSR